MKNLLTILCAFVAITVPGAVLAQNRAVSKNIDTQELLEGFETGGETIKISAGGTMEWTAGATLDNAADFRASAGLIIGTHVQAYHANLSTWASIDPSTDIQAFVSAANNAAARAALGAQTLDADLTALAALTGTSTLYYRSADAAWSPVTYGNGMAFSGGVLSAAFGGSAGSVDNAVMAADGTGGGTLQAREVTISDGTTSTTNNVVLANAHTGQTNSWIGIRPKGDGGFFLGPPPDGTFVGGNARGTESIDLQVDRSVATQVAAGSSSAVLGARSRASGQYAVALGYNANAAGESSLAAQGGFTTNDANHGVSLGALVYSPYGFGVGPALVTAPYGFATGAGGPNARIEGERARAAGTFGMNDDATASEFVLRCTTSDATANVEMFTGESANQRLVLDQYSTWSFQVLVVARRTDSTVSHGCYTSVGVIRRESTAGSVVLGGGTVTTVSETVAGWNVVVSADTTNGSLKVAVTGAAATPIQWVATVTVVRTKNSAP